jgi:putative membrane protein
MHWHHSYGSGMWIGMVGGTLLGWILLVGIGYLVIRAVLADSASPANQPGPVFLLDQRLARGEIAIDDYQRRRELLSQRSTAQPPEPDRPSHG